MATRAAIAALLVAAVVPAAVPAGRSAPVPRLLDLQVGNGATPFAGDQRLLTTVSPNGDRFRDKAIVRFRLDAPATVELDVLQTLNVKRGQNVVRTILTQSYPFEAGRHRLAWIPARTVPNGTYVLELTVIDAQGHKRVYNDFPLAGQVQVMFDVTPTSLPHIKAGKLRALGVTTTEPLGFLPDVPTIDSFLKGYEAAGWIGFGVPRGTPPEMIVTLNRQTNAAVLDPNVKQRIADLGAVAVPPNSPDEFAKFIAQNIDKWTKVIKFAGIKPQ